MRKSMEKTNSSKYCDEIRRDQIAESKLICRSPANHLTIFFFFSVVNFVIFLSSIIRAEYKVTWPRFYETRSRHVIILDCGATEIYPQRERTSLGGAPHHCGLRYFLQRNANELGTTWDINWAEAYAPRALCSLAYESTVSNPGCSALSK